MLTDSDGNLVTLDPVFDPTRPDYTVHADYKLNEITVAATINDNAATLDYFDDDDNPLTDFSSDEGHQLSLVRGENVIRVKVTAGDDTTTQIYRVVVTRADPPVLTISGTAKVSETLTVDTGELPDLEFAYQWMRLDASGENPANIPGATEQTYELVTGDRGKKIQVAVSYTDNRGLAEETLISDAFPEEGAIAQADITDATLSALTVNDGTNDLTLDPTFASGTYTYAVAAGNDVTSVTLTATPNYAGGSVTGVTLGGTAITDTDFTDGITVPSLAVGANVIVVTVTAEDTTTTETYTLTVTRAAELPAHCETHDIWCATLTVKHHWSIPDWFGWSSDSSVFPDSTIKYGSGHGRTVTFESGSTGNVAALVDRAPAQGDGLQVEFDSTATWLETEANRNTLIVLVDGREFAVADATYTRSTLSDPHQYLLEWPGSGLTWSTDDEVEVRFGRRQEDASTDATLSALALTDLGGNAVGLDPAFDQGTNEYDASVANGVDDVTVAPTANDGEATVAYLDVDGNELTDANDDADGHQVALVAGANIVKVKVTAEDRIVTRTYTLTITRAEPPVLPSGSVLVSNLDQSLANGNPGFDKDGLAQKFTVKAGQDYTLTAATVKVSNGTSKFSAAIHEVDENNSLNPAAAPLYVFTTPGTMSSGNRTFTAPLGATLKGGTSYFLFLTSITDASFISVTRSDNLDSGSVAGWTITRPGRIASGSGNNPWNNISLSRALRMRLNGVEKEADNTDATLSALVLTESDGNPVTLDSVFDPTRPDYTAHADYRVNEITVAATLSDNAATLDYFDDEDNPLTDFSSDEGHQLSLVRGENVIRVKVTAGDDTTTQTYRVVVTRADPPVLTISGTAQVGETLTVDTGELPDLEFTYRWMRLDANGENPANIPGATEQTYGLVTGDQGKKIQVAVSYTDNRGLAEETLISDAFPEEGAIAGTATAGLAASLVERDPVDGPGGRLHYVFDLQLSAAVFKSFRDVRDHVFTVTGGSLVKAKRIHREKQFVPATGQLGMSSNHWRLQVRPDVADGEVTVAMTAGRPCHEAGALCAPDGSPLSNAPSLTLMAEYPTLSIADTSAHEDDGWLRFTVTVSRPSERYYVVYDFETIPPDDPASGTATEGTDYIRRSTPAGCDQCYEWMWIGAATDEQIVRIIDDVVNDDGETVKVRISNARLEKEDDDGDPTNNVVKVLDITRDVATGTIHNDDSLQRAWLARFGRTVGTHVTDAVSERMRRGPERESHLTLGGQRLALGERTRMHRAPEREPHLAIGGQGLAPSERTTDEAGAGWNGPSVSGGGETEPSGSGSGGTEPSMSGGRALASALLQALTGIPGPVAAQGDDAEAALGAAAGLDAGAAWSGPGPERTRPIEIDPRRLLLGSSFHLDLNAGQAGAAAPRVTAWGRFAGTAFDAREGELSLDGEVLTGTAGVDVTRGRLLLGLAAAHSRGDGSFGGGGGGGEEPSGGGTLESTVTSLHPYLRYEVTDRLDVWGTFGHGRGELTVAQDGAPALEADLSLRTGAFGARGVVLRPAEPRGLELATRADVLLTRTTTDEADGAAGEGRLAAEEADAHRLRLVVEGSRAYAWPTGRTLAPSLELGLRRDWGDAETGLGLELGARVGYTDPAAGLSMQGTVRGLLAHEDGDYREWGASATVRFAPGDAGRGLSLNVSPTWGAAASGVEGLWSRQSAEGLAPAGDPPRSARLAAEAGYGFVAFGTGRVTPYVGAEWAQGSARTYRLGTRLSVGGPAASGLTVTLEAHHQEPADQGPAERSLALQLGLTF